MSVEYIFVNKDTGEYIDPFDFGEGGRCTQIPFYEFGKFCLYMMLFNNWVNVAFLEDGQKEYYDYKYPLGHRNVSVTAKYLEDYNYIKSG